MKFACFKPVFFLISYTSSKLLFSPLHPSSFFSFHLFFPFEKVRQEKVGSRQYGWKEDGLYKRVHTSDHSVYGSTPNDRSFTFVQQALSLSLFSKQTHFTVIYTVFVTRHMPSYTRFREIMKKDEIILYCITHPSFLNLCPFLTGMRGLDQVGSP